MDCPRARSSLRCHRMPAFNLRTFQIRIQGIRESDVRECRRRPLRWIEFRDPRGERPWPAHNSAPPWGRSTASSARGPWRACPTPGCWNGTSPTATSWPSRPWSGGTGRWSWASADGVLDDPNDADDAFQAAFLLLARKARSIWVDDSLGGWLHRVAWRIALQVKSDAARRRDQERRGGRAGRRAGRARPGARRHRPR